MLGILWVALFSMVSTVASAEGADLDDRWESSIRSTYFGSRAVTVDDNAVIIKAPRKTDDATLVPINVLVSGEGVRRVHVIIDTNPQPVVGVFVPARALAVLDIGLRVRLDRSSMLRAVAEYSDGRLVMGTQHIKTVGGGCSAPPTTDVPKALREIGRMNMRMMHRDSAHGLNFTQLMIRHPNLNGMQRDLVTGGYYPAQYLSRVSLAFNDEPLLDADVGFSLSTDPVIRFALPGGDGTLAVAAEDSRGNRFASRFKVIDGAVAGRLNADEAASVESGP